MNCIIPKLSNQFSFSNTDSEMDGGNHIILQPQLCTIYMQYYLFNSSQNCYTIYKPPILKTGGAFAAPQSTTTTSTQQRSTTTAGPYVDEQNQWRLERRERRPKQLKACQKCRAQPQQHQLQSELKIEKQCNNKYVAQLSTKFFVCFLLDEDAWARRDPSSAHQCRF